jgi:hypothetical protein
MDNILWYNESETVTNLYRKIWLRTETGGLLSVCFTIILLNTTPSEKMTIYLSLLLQYQGAVSTLDIRSLKEV